LAYMKATIDAAKSTTYAAVVGTVKCKSREHLNATLKDVLKKGGEGLMLRQVGSMYASGRSSTLQKVKTFHDEEAKVTGHEKVTTTHNDIHLYLILYDLDRSIAAEV
jgi:ATP-dependent DNA ligase